MSVEQVESQKVKILAQIFRRFYTEILQLGLYWSGELLYHT